jgi:phage terminase large subunit-like protein
VLERRKSEASRFRDFENDGDLSLVRQIGEDVLEVAQIAARLNDSGKLDKIGVDPQGIGAIVDAMISEGVEQDKIIGISQGWKLTSAIKTVERKLAEGGLYHCGRPMMAWCVGNARVEPRGNAVIITKQAAGFAKIDPLMALFNAAALMALNPAGGASLDSIINFPISA